MKRKLQGFSLVELSIVLVVVGLLLGTTILGLSDFIWHARNAQVKKDLELIEEALIGYAISVGGFPCPDTNGVADGMGDDDGTGAACDDVKGFLPWVDLGLKPHDPWNNPYFYRIDPNYDKPNPGDQVVAFTLTTADGNIVVRDKSVANGGGNIIANGIAAIFFSAGPNGYLVQADASSDEDENLNNTLTFVDKTYVSADAASEPDNPEFDDIVHWISSFSLKSKMAKAQRLP